MNKKLLILSILAMILSGCASLPSPEKIKSEIEGYELPVKPNDKEGMVYVIRPSNLGSLVRFNVFLDDKKPESEMGWNRGRQHIYFYASPGKHKVYSKAENWDNVDINVEAGEVVFVKQLTSMGLIMARNKLKLIEEDHGKYFMKKTKLGKIKKKRKN